MLDSNCAFTISIKTAVRIQTLSDLMHYREPSDCEVIIARLKPENGRVEGAVLLCWTILFK